MAFQINTNVPSLQAQEYLRMSSEFQNKTINRVTSGLRIIASGDDAAGLAIANGLRSDQAVLTQGIRNANDGLSTLQIIDGGINNISKLLDRARTLATQSASGTFTGSRSVLNSEFQSLITEINRQAQSIGLDPGGQFAKNLQVFIGGGKSNAGVSEIDNGSVSVDLSASTVDAQSLGLSGVRAASEEGTDLSTSSSTSVEDILADTTNTGSLQTGGFTDFYFRGAGFSDDNRVKVSVNLSGITNTETLVAALNDSIETAGLGSTAAATAFKNANIKAEVVTDTQTDGSVKERLGFTSSEGAFQVQAGDRLANALLGNFSSGAAGQSLENVFAARAATQASGTTFGATGAGNIIFRITGGGLGSPVDLVLTTTATTTIDEALTSLSTSVANNVALQAAGITLDNIAAGGTLVFRSKSGESINVQVAGDVRNRFGLGTYRLDSTTSTSFDYSSVTSSGFTANAALAQTFEFSIAGGAKQSITVAAGGASSQAVAISSLNALFNANSVLQAAGLQAVAAGAEITIQSTNGSAFRINTVNEAVAGTFGFGGAGVAETVAYDDNNANSVIGTVSSAITVTTGSNDKFYFKINGGATQTVTLAGTEVSISDVVTTLNADGTFNAQLRAQAVNGKLLITSLDSDVFQIVSGTNSVNSTVGIEDNLKSLPDKAAVNSGGAYQTELGTNDDVISWNQIRYGTDEQTITVFANDPTGAQRSLAITLRHDAVGRNARSLDEAIQTINDTLQNSGDPTLKEVVAVKEQNYDGTGEGVRFLSALQDYRVSLGNVGSSTPSSETGFYDATTGSGILGQGSVLTAAESEGGAQLDISNQNAAESAVSALATAVSKLGDAQAVVGRGQNQFSFAVNLAQSQLTNLAAAESRIRDADLAQEAANLTKAQIILQAGIAALAQANAAPQAVLALLRG